MGGALAVASKSEQVFTSALASGQKQLANRIMPGQPMTFDSTLAAFYASEYVKTLEQTARGAEMLAKVSGLLADAIAQRDSVKQFILTGGMLSTTYDRLGVDPQALYQTLAKTLADGNATRTGPGAELLPYLQQGGSGTLAGLAVAARVAIMRAQADFDAYLSQVTRQYMPGMSR